VPELLFEWTSLDYTWSSTAERDQAIANSDFIVENCALTSVKYWQDTYYVTVPRWREGVPATLNKVVVVNGQPLLQPYPSWQMNTLGNSGAFVSVQSLEIDLRGRMWIIDSGRMNIFSANASATNGSARIFIYDIAAHSLVRTYTFPQAVASRSANFLMDIVVDARRGYAYISDAGTGALIVYDYNTDTSRRIVSWGMPAESNHFSTNILGVTYNFTTPMNGLALSPDASKLFYCPLAGYHIHAIRTADLRDFGVSAVTINNDVIDKGTKQSISDGLAFSAAGVMYFGLINDNALAKWNVTAGPLASHQTIVAVNETTHNWIDSLTFDDAGHLIYLTNRLQLFLFGGMNFNDSDPNSDANFRVFRLYVNESSYLVGQNSISAAATSFSTHVIVLVIFIVLSIALML
jgi:sugar lactone lactonase YvrE